MNRKYHLQLAKRKTPASTSAMVLAKAPAIPNKASFLACSAGSGYIWTESLVFQARTLTGDLPIMLIAEGMVRTASKAENALRT